MFSRLFRNRWSALLWSAGILWTAYDVAGGATGPAEQANAAAAVDATGDRIDQAALASFANAAP